MQKIKAELFDNPLYTVTHTNTDKLSVSFVDFNTTPATNLSMSSITPSVIIKNIQLHRLDISIPNTRFQNNAELQETHILYNYIKNEINKEYFKIITKLGEKNRIDAPTAAFDVFIDTLKKDKTPNIGRRIYSKFLSASSYIASNGRMGPAQWLTSNFKTYKYILNYLDMELVYDNNSNLLIGNIPYLVNDLIDDDSILIGRKNSITQTGCHCTILTDKDGYIITNEHVNTEYYDYNKTISVYFSVDDFGITPQTQFLKIGTRSLTYYRCKKLQRIKELYGDGV